MRLDAAMKTLLTVLILTALGLVMAGYGRTGSLMLLAILLTGNLAFVWVPLWRNRKRR